MSAALPLPPGPRGHFALGVLPEFQHDLLGLYRDSAREYGDVVRLRLLNVNTYAVNHPAHIRYVLETNKDNYRRSPLVNAVARPVVGESVLTTDGAPWHARRTAVEPPLSSAHSAAWASGLSRATDALLQRLDAYGAQPFDLQAEARLWSLQALALALIGADVTGADAGLREAFLTVYADRDARLINPLLLPLSVPTPHHRQVRRAFDALDRLMREQIRAHLKQPRADILGDLIGAGAGKALGEEGLKNETLTLLFGGYEPPASTLTWAAYLLAQHPEAQAQMGSEGASVLQGHAPNAADGPRLVYTGRVIQETLRLYPPAWAMGRESLGQDELGGYRIPAHAMLNLMFMNAHRDPRWWSEPDAFNPDRFVEEGEASRPPYAYLPFGAGPHECVGEAFALAACRLALAAVIQRFRVELAPGVTAEPAPGFSLHARHGLKVRLTPR